MVTLPCDEREEWAAQELSGWTQGEANPRFVVASLMPEEAGARRLYEKVYCARGDMENRIKECQPDRSLR